MDPVEAESTLQTGKSKPMLLLVCEANVCRSPVAQGFCQIYFQQHRVLSAGLRTRAGFEAHPKMVELMLQRNIDLSGHRTQRLHPGMVTGAQWILTMDQDQKARLHERFPAHASRIVLLGQHIGVEIPDPIHRPLSEFEQIVDLIDAALQPWRRLIGSAPTCIV